MKFLQPRRGSIHPCTPSSGYASEIAEKVLRCEILSQKNSNLHLSRRVCLQYWATLGDRTMTIHVSLNESTKILRQLLPGWYFRRWGTTTSLLLNRLRGLQPMKASETIDYKLALFIYKCRQGAAPLYLADELSEPTDFEARCRLRSASSSSLVIRRRSSFSGCCGPCLEQYTAVRHIRAVTSSLPQSP